MHFSNLHKGSLLAMFATMCCNVQLSPRQVRTSRCLGFIVSAFLLSVTINVFGRGALNYVLLFLSRFFFFFLASAVGVTPECHLGS